MSEDYYSVRLNSPSFQSCWRYLQCGNFEAALEHSENVIRLHPSEPEGFIFKARALFNLGQLNEAETALIEVMKIAKESERLRGDVEGMIKLRDELANIRVELLKKLKFTDSHDIAEMHWSNNNASILDLIGYTSRLLTSPSTSSGVSKKRNSFEPFKQHLEPMDMEEHSFGKKRNHNEVNDLRNHLEHKKLMTQLTSDLMKPTKTSTPFKGSPSQRLSDSYKPNMFQPRSSPRKAPEVIEIADEELKLKTAGFQTQYMLAEEKIKKLESKVRNQEEELKNAFTQVIKMDGVIKDKQDEIEILKNDLQKALQEVDVWKNRYYQEADRNEGRMRRDFDY